ncbi:MAG: prefoldin subunit alpha [Candidatus Helarchaeota archaeon]
MSNSQPNEEDPQKIFYQISVALKQREEQVSVLQNQMGLIYNRIETYEITRRTVENIKEMKEGQEILVPIGDTIVFKAKIMDTQNFIVNIGADVMIVKNIEDTMKYIDKNIEILNNRKQEIEIIYQKIAQEINELQRKKNSLLQMFSQKGSI